MKSPDFQLRALRLELTETSDAVYVKWFGRSTDREPGHFILPVLITALQLATGANKGVVLDFHKAEYFNSSTITPSSASWRRSSAAPSTSWSCITGV